VNLPATILAVVLILPLALVLGLVGISVAVGLRLKYERFRGWV
jgi:hypothetical protein